MNVNGFTEVVISVEDIARIRNAFTGVAGWTFNDLPDAPAEQFSAWHVPDSCERIPVSYTHLTLPTKRIV